MIKQRRGDWGAGIFPTDIPLVTEKPRHLGQKWDGVGSGFINKTAVTNCWHVFWPMEKSLKCSKKNNSKIKTSHSLSNCEVWLFSFLKILMVFSFIICHQSLDLYDLLGNNDHQTVLVMSGYGSLSLLPFTSGGNFFDGDWTRPGSKSTVACHLESFYCYIWFSDQYYLILLLVSGLSCLWFLVTHAVSGRGPVSCSEL